MNGHHPGKGNPPWEQNPAYGLLQPIFYALKDAHVNDQATWEKAVMTASDWYSGLPSDIRTELDELLEEIMLFKRKLVELVTASGSSSTCRTCGGECCLLGKYHVSVLDILAYRKTGVEPVTPVFTAGPACPYSDDSGCLMPAGYRPVTCVIFNCQLIENRLTTADREAVHQYEKRLRDAVSRTGHASGVRLDRPLLLSCS
jgi:hypothetical protein